MMPSDELNKGIHGISLKNKKILLVEDGKLNQFIATQLLESWGCEVMIANNGREALVMLELNFFDCILMDVKMPELDGVEATELIRKFADPSKSSVPIIALTANALISDREKYVKAGMNDCIPKPIEEFKLFAGLVKNILKRDILASDGIIQGLMINETNQPEEKIYDLTMVHSVSGGDTAFIKKMVRLFIETVPQNVAELKQSVETENWDQAAKLAHKLKSTIDSMGIRSIHQEIRSVESNAKQKANLKEVPLLVQKIESAIATCVRQLQAEI